MVRLVLLVAALGACKFSAQPATGVDPDAPKEIDAPATPDDATTDATVVPIDAPPDAPPVPTVRRDCRAWHEAGITVDGPQMIDPDDAGGNAPYLAYCDMTTAGGGWTLVWSYGFTNYPQFTMSNNAVTPVPTWGSSSNTTSTTVPATPMTPGALVFSQWAGLGPDFLVESNINHWISCQPGTGSLATLTFGSLTCQVVKAVATQCLTTAPDRVSKYGNEVGLWAGGGTTNTYYFWDGLTSANWPTHDPCGNNAARQVTGVANPYGAVFLRRP